MLLLCQVSRKTPRWAWGKKTARYLGEVSVCKSPLVGREGERGMIYQQGTRSNRSKEACLRRIIIFLLFHCFFYVQYHETISVPPCTRSLSLFLCSSSLHPRFFVRNQASCNILRSNAYHVLEFTTNVGPGTCQGNALNTPS